jgi:hypothetical protein
VQSPLKIASHESQDTWKAWGRWLGKPGGPLRCIPGYLSAEHPRIFQREGLIMCQATITHEWAHVHLLTRFLGILKLEVDFLPGWLWCFGAIADQRVWTKHPRMFLHMREIIHQDMWLALCNRDRRLLYGIMRCKNSMRGVIWQDRCRPLRCKHGHHFTGYFRISCEMALIARQDVRMQ